MICIFSCINLIIGVSDLKNFNFPLVTPRLILLLIFGHINAPTTNNIFIDIKTAVNFGDAHLNIRADLRQICRRSEVKLHTFLKSNTIWKQLFSCTQCRFISRRTTGNECGCASTISQEKNILLFYGIEYLLCKP